MPVDQRRAMYLDAMGIQRWVVRQPQAQSTLPSAVATSPQVIEDQSDDPAAVGPGTTAEGWEALQQQVAQCQLCELHKSRTQTVFGVGDPRADLLIVGEAPGADEDRQGEPFVGRAGRLLNEMLRAIGLDRNSVYIANILKCRPPNNRDPKPEEAACCVDYLYRQIEYIQPRLILALGRIAAQRLLQTDTSLARLRSRVHALPRTQTPFIVTYHPAYLLRSPLDKRKAWEDLLFVVRHLQ